MIIVTSSLSATNNDVLNGTDLDSIPTAGVLVIWAASTVADSTITITGPGSEPVVRNRPLPLRANGMPDKLSDQPFSVGVIQGGHYVVDITEVTAMTVTMIAVWYDAQDIAAGLLYR